ncbi:PREDICTED: uncharacterized protein LOC109206346 isoform X2 [Nicotiana attenuata]|nr:PREDICTED: uncharacterized protein LOC109206346 isoform X2 [Nicotiana attenuata]
MVKDASGMFSGVQSQPSVQHSPNDEAKRFYEHLEEASHPLYEGSMHSKLSVAHGLLFIKSHWNVSVAAMDYIIGLMNELDPNKIDLPNNYYTTKKLVPKRGEVGALDGLQRLIIAPDGTNGFFPNTLSTRAVMDCFIAFYRHAWETWREIPYIVRDHMWNYFKVKCSWYAQHDHQISCNFEKKVADMLKDTLRTAQRKRQKPTWMLEDIWTRLNEKRDIAEFQKKSTKGKAARASKKGSLHNGGSEKLKGRTMNDEVFEETHVKKKKDGTRSLVKPHAEGTYDGHTKGLDEWRQSQPVGGSSTQPSSDDVASRLSGASSSSSQNEEEIDSLRRQIQETSEKHEANSLKLDRLEDLMHKLMDSRRSDPQSDSDNEN